MKRIWEIDTHTMFYLLIFMALLGSVTEGVWFVSLARGIAHLIHDFTVIPFLVWSAQRTTKVQSKL